MKLRTQKSRIIFKQETFVDYKDRENVFWDGWARISMKVVKSFVELTCQFYFVKRITGRILSALKLEKRYGLHSKIAPLNIGRANDKLVLIKG